MENVQLREKQYRYRVIPIKTTTIGKGNCFYQQNTRPLGIHNLTPFLMLMNILLLMCGSYNSEPVVIQYLSLLG
jgi:hypothetical protein